MSPTAAHNTAVNSRSQSGSSVNALSKHSSSALSTVLCCAMSDMEGELARLRVLCEVRVEQFRARSRVCDVPCLHPEELGSEVDVRIGKQADERFKFVPDRRGHFFESLADGWARLSAGLPSLPSCFTLFVSKPALGILGIMFIG
jgi:hypothetical protein